MFWRRNITVTLPRNSGGHVQTPSPPPPPMKPSGDHHWRPFRSLIETLKRLVFFVGLVFILVLTWWSWDRLSRPTPTRTSPADAAGNASASGLDSKVNSNHRKTLPVNPTAMSITHQSFLKSFFIENPRQNGLSGKRECSLTEWLQNRKALGIGPLAEFKVPGSSTTVTYVRDDIRVLIRSLVRFLQDLHSRKCCTDGVQATDIFIREESMNFKNLNPTTFSEGLQKVDYLCLMNIIKLTIFKDNKELPYDIEHFLMLLKNPGKHTYLINGHVALMNLNTCRSFIMLLWDKKKSVEQPVFSKWNQAVNELSCMDKWSQQIDQQSPLYEAYKGGKYTDSKKADLIRFFRNAAAHLMDYSGRGKIFQFEHISLLIIASFPKTLADLQERLNYHGVLQEFTVTDGAD